MVDKDVFQYFEDNQQFKSCKKTITDISSSQNGTPLVDCPKEIYSFDDISETIYKKNKPSSADGIIVTKERLYFIEFKSGFRKKITKDNFNKKKMGCPRYEENCSAANDGKCPYGNVFQNQERWCKKAQGNCYRYNSYCKDYADITLKKLNLETEELKTSIRMKAIDSYITLEKHILPLCNNCSDKKKYQIFYIVVIDGNSEDKMLSTLNELAAKDCSESKNCYDDLEKSLGNYSNKKDVNGNDYYYDEIMVFSPHEFEEYFKDKI